MERYGRCGGRSGVSHYEMGPGFIQLRFRNGPRIYVYSEQRPGLGKVLMMQCLALEGQGLAEFVHEHASGEYESWFVPAQAAEQNRDRSPA